MLVENQKTLVRYQVGAMPLIQHIITRLHLKERLAEQLPLHANELVSSVDTLILLISNLVIGKMPLYKLNDWVGSIDLRCFGHKKPDSFTVSDDKFGRALDKLYQADRASLMTQVVLSAIKEFNINLAQIHNDSTTIEAYGDIAGVTRTGVELKRGYNPNRGSDLKQLIFNLSISADGGVPIHHKTYPGNRTDDTLHIESWNTLTQICQSVHFLYVADSKLCTDEQLNYIVTHGGRAITIIPNTWNETRVFKEKLRETTIARTEVWRRVKPGTTDELEYFSVYSGNYFTEKRGYRIHWIHSSEKKKKDRERRNQQFQRAEKELASLVGELNTKKYKTREAISAKAEEILKKYHVSELITFKIGTVKSKETKQIGKGRPSATTEYQEIIHELFTLYWMRHASLIKQEMKLDGLFPLLSTDISLSSEQVLKSYKYQPKIEKRFSQFKSIHHAAPLLFKSITRVEANLFAFFIALMVQALIEREVQKLMKERKIANLDVYSEQRSSTKPTANAIFQLFEPISTYQIKQGDKVIETYQDKLNKTQCLILDLLGLSKEQYWNTTN